FRLIGFPKLQLSRSRKQFFDTVYVFCARQFDQNTTRLTQTLDIRLDYAKFIDTLVQYFKSRGNRLVYLAVDDFFDLRIGHIDVYVIAHEPVLDYLGRSEFGSVGNLGTFVVE